MKTALPAWARPWAGPLPATTARMLELDALHRSGDRLPPQLRGLARWAAADANRCDYAKAVAVADLLRAGFSASELPAFTGDPSRLSPEERAAVAFARKMMREAHAVTDEEMKQLLEYFGEEQVVALVALLAHAGFQDRLFLATNVQARPGDLLPPALPPLTKTTNAAGASNAGGQEKWLALRGSVSRQQSRPGRIRVPSQEEVRKRLGDDHPVFGWQSDIVWSRVCYGYQPELTDAWFACVAAFRQEAALDRIFEQSLFWIVTRSLRCFY